ncbi:MAG: hypothetical protein U1E53_22615 [Dongiaceae bacterium]
MSEPRDGGRVVRLLSGSILDQALLSGANFAAGLLFVRHGSAQAYGLYVLVTATLLLVTGMQGALISTPLSVIVAGRDEVERAAMTRTLLTAQFRLWLPGAAVAFLLLTASAAAGWLPPGAARAGQVACVIAPILLAREFLRSTLLLYGRIPALLVADALYVALQVAVVAAAVQLASAPVPVVLAGSGAAALLATAVAWTAFGRQVGWSQRRVPGALGKVLRLGGWGFAGALVTWLQNQGFYYLLAGLAGAPEVALVAAARLLLTPVNLMLMGIGPSLLPQAARWHAERGLGPLCGRLGLIALALLAGAAAYVALLWLLRVPIVGGLLRLDPAALTPLLLLWAAAAAMLVCRTLAMIALQALSRFRRLLWLAAIAAALSLLAAWWGIGQFGAAASIAGVLLGETIYLIGTLLSLRTERRFPTPPG